MRGGGGGWYKALAGAELSLSLCPNGSLDVRSLLSMDALYQQTLHNMESTLADLAARVLPPQRIPLLTSFVFRYVEKSLHQAIVQKLARIISGLYAARILLERGFLQEQGALQRMLDEFQEDVIFLSFAAINNDETELHRRYLEAFYEEEFDKPGDAISSTQKRPMIPRDKIRAYISRIEGGGLDSSSHVAATRTVSKAYSGYVHGASPHIIEMYGGDPPRFHVAGQRDSALYADHEKDLRNQFYRGICSFGLAAKAFGVEALSSSIQKYVDEFAKQSGMGSK